MGGARWERGFDMVMRAMLSLPNLAKNPCVCPACRPVTRMVKETVIEDVKGKKVKKEIERLLVEQPGKLQHYFCAICGAGPFTFRSRPPWFRGQQNVYDEHGKVGEPVAYYACGKECYGRIDAQRIAQESAALSKWRNVGPPGSARGGTSDELGDGSG